MLKLLKRITTRDAKRTKSSNEPDSLNLIGLPQVVMIEILERLDFQSILRLRKTCKPLRHFIDEHGNLGLLHFAIRYFKTGICLVISDETIYFCLEYTKMKKGCRLKWRRTDHETGTYPFNCQKDFKNENFADFLFRDLEIIMSLQHSTLKEFEAYFKPSYSPEFRSETQVYLQEFAQRLQSIMKTQKLKSTMYSTSVPNHHYLMCILPYLDSDALKRITIHNSNYTRNMEKYLKIYEVASLDQWKKAEKLGVYDFIIPKDFENFRSFSDITVSFEDIDYVDLVDWKERLLQYPHLQSIRIRYESIDQDRMNELFGQFMNEDRESFIRRNCFFKIPNSNVGIHIALCNMQMVVIQREEFFSTFPYGSFHLV